MNESAIKSEKSTDKGSPSALPQSDEPVDLDPAEFTVKVTNPWFPLEPGTRWAYSETTEDAEEVRVVVTATAGTRKIANGLTARIVRDTVTQNGEIIEDTFDWYAQDAGGTVWYLGEDTAEFENGKISTRAGSFEAGVDGAQPGVIMPASPKAGMTYRQEYYEGEAEDRGEMLAIGEQASVQSGDYDGLVKTADTTPLEPDVLEHKYYAERCRAGPHYRQGGRRPRGASVRHPDPSSRCPARRASAAWKAVLNRSPSLLRSRQGRPADSTAMRHIRTSA